MVTVERFLAKGYRQKVSGKGRASVVGAKVL